MEKTPNTINYFAQTDFRGKKTTFGIKDDDRARHFYVIGKTGMGKSTIFENMAIQDIKNGEGLAFLDPHGSTAEKLLDFVPKERIKDVIYFAPFDLDYPIGFNVMEDVGKDQRHLVANGLMSSFKKIWPDVWSSRMEYILNNCLLALLEYPNSTLLGVNRMLSDKGYRETVVNNIVDPSVKAFWTDEFAKYNERYMQEAGDAIKNKIGQFTSNPLIRNIVGQPKSTLDFRKIMDEKKILIINLSKGRLGEQNANLIGGMLITKMYLAAMSRASATPAEREAMPYFYMFVDEFQSFVNESFADILSEARKYKLSLHIAHQYVEQMPENVQAAVFGNVGSIVAFRVGPLDAELLEKIFFPTFTKEDIVNLGFAQVYLTLMIDGVGSPPFSAKTLPPIVVLDESYSKEIIAYTREHFACPREKVEKNIVSWHDEQHVAAKTAPKKEGSGNFVNRDNRDNRERRPLPPRREEPVKRENTLATAIKTAFEKPKEAVAVPVPPPMPKVEPVIIKPVNPPSPPSAPRLSLKRLQPQPKDTGRYKDELRAVLQNIMKREEEAPKQEKAKPEKRAEPSQEQTPRSEVKEKQEIKEIKETKEVPEDVLRQMLQVDINK